MKRCKKSGLFFLVMLCMLLTMGMSASAGFRKMSNGKYRYYVSKKKYISGDKNATDYRQWTFRTIGSKKRYTYCFDGDGYMLKGWKLLTTKASGGVYHWYYFDKNGRMLKNRTKNGHYLQKNGQMLTNDWYNGSYYGEDGALIQGYKQDVKMGFRRTKKGTKYRKADGNYAAKEWLCIKDSVGKQYWYYFYSNGIMAKNKWLGDHYVDRNGRWIVGKKKK